METNSVTQLLTETLDFFKRCPLTDEQIAARMGTNRSTLARIKSVAISIKEVLETGEGQLQPLFPKAAFTAMLWAARPRPVTPVYIQYMERLEALYGEAEKLMAMRMAPRRYSTTTTLRTAAKQARTDALPYRPDFKERVEASG